MSDSTLHLQSKRLLIRELVPDDLRQMKSWREFDDPSYRLWNIPRRVLPRPVVWSVLNGPSSSRLWFAVERLADRRLVGSIALREITGHDSARLGISFGAEYVDQGYGTEALRTFFGYYFGELRFRSLLLDVAATNNRARHVYQKLGFQYRGQHFRTIPREEALEFLHDERCERLRRYFRRHFARTQLLFFDMVLERDTWHCKSLADAPSPIRAEALD